jgi:hypothetical protein
VLRDLYTGQALREAMAEAFSGTPPPDAKK